MKSEQSVEQENKPSRPEKSMLKEWWTGIFGSTSKRYRIWLLVIFLASVVLNFGMVLINRESNDNHTKVIILTMQNGELPTKDDCSECFSPKFYHWVAAKAMQLAGISPLNHNFHVNFGAELLNFAAGTLMLLFVALFITRLPESSEILKLIAFGMVALNPKLIGINSQATNDTFGIVLSTLALYFTWRYFNQPQKRWFVLLLVFLSLGMASKTNIVVTGIAIALAFLVRAWTARINKGRAWVAAGIFIVAILILNVINPFTQYITNTQRYGTPLLTNTGNPVPPKFFEHSTYERPGVLSVADALFTFKFIDLLKHPLISNGAEYSPNRTSLWTQLYGRAHSVHFDNWPYTWQPVDDRDYPLSRAIYILALLPTLLMLLGAFLEFASVIKAVFKRDNTLSARSAHGLFIITFAGYVAFVALYALLYRDFSYMKAIFIYPAILGFPYFFIRGVRFVMDRMKKPVAWAGVASLAWILLLFILYAAEIVTLIQLIYSKTDLSTIF